MTDGTSLRERMRRFAAVATLPLAAAALLVGAGVTPAAAAPAPAAASQFFLGNESDACSGNLYVKNSDNVFVFIPRDDQYHRVDVHVDGNNWWYWRCGTTNERARGEPAWAFRVERLYVRHSTDSRDIAWACYELA